MPGGPQPDNRNPSGHGPQHHHFGPPFTGNFERSEGGVAGPQGESGPADQPVAPTPPPDGFGSAPEPAASGDVI
jgi:hypothetical protein